MHGLLFFGLLVAFFTAWILAMNFLRGKIKPGGGSRSEGSDDTGIGQDGGHGGGFDGFGGGESGGGGADGH